MLQQIREKTTGWVAFFIIALISIPFVFWGVDSFFTGGPVPAVAEVEGNEITQPEYQRAYQNRYQIEQYIRGADAEIDEVALKSNVIDGLVNRLLLVNWTERKGYGISNEQVGKAIRENPRFQADGKFSFEQYKDTIANQGYTTKRYEAEERQRLRLTQFRDQTSNNTLVPRSEVERLYRVENQKRDLQVVTIAVADLKDDIEITEAEIEAYYQDHLDDYLTDPRMQVQFVELRVADFAAGIEVSEEQLKSRYEAELTRFETEEERRGAHILIKTDDDTDLDTARARITELKAEIEAGADFAEVAKEHSDDTGSAKNGGDLGFAAKDGRFVEPFENALFEIAEVGQLSEPVESQFGVHLIKLEELKAQTIEPFEQVRARLETEYRNDEARLKFTEERDRLWDLTLETPDSLNPAADELGLELFTTDWFSRSSGTGIAANANIRAAAFDGSVREDGDNTDVLEITDDHIVVLRKAGYEPARQKGLAEVTANIKIDMLDKRANELAAERSAALVVAVEAGESLPAAAAAVNLDVTEHVGVLRSAATPDLGIVESAFKLPRPSADAARVTAVELLNGDRAVVVVSKVTEGDIANATEAELTALKARIAGQRGNTEFAALIKDMRANAKVKIAEGRL